MLLFIGAMNHLAAPHHQEARVTEVTRVQPVTPPIQSHDAGRAAAYTTRQEKKTWLEGKNVNVCAGLDRWQVKKDQAEFV